MILTSAFPFTAEKGTKVTYHVILRRFTTPSKSLESYSIFATYTVSPAVFPEKYDFH